MKTVWKFPIPIQDEVIEVPMPKDAEIVYVACQKEVVCLWALVETEAEKEVRKFRIYGTGHEIRPNVGTGYNTYDTYVGTAIQFGGDLIWHVFEVI